MTPLRASHGEHSETVATEDITIADVLDDQQWFDMHWGCTGRPKSPPEADRNRHPRPTEIAT